AGGITGLMKLPQRVHARMDALRAREHFTADGGVRHQALVGDDRPRHGDRALGTVRRLTDAPFALPVADVSRNGRTGCSLETADTVRVAAPDVVVGEQLGLCADGVAGRDALEA